MKRAEEAKECDESSKERGGQNLALVAAGTPLEDLSLCTYL